MRRVGHLWETVIARGNLVAAFHQAARGKRRKPAVRAFASDLDARLAAMRHELEAGTFETGRFTVFQVYDPKERTIHAPAFAEQVFHHALMNVCEPVLERRAVHHSYACRRGKGRLAAVAAARKAAAAHAWHLKLDIRKYFDSVPHGRLLDRLGRVFKDPAVTEWFGRVIRSHGGGAGRGLPIGSLTSQHLANFYLGALDQHCQRLPGVRAYVRYMDDFVCWADDKAALIAAGRSIAAFVEGTLGLDLKHPPRPQRSARGMDYLGERIFPGFSEPSRRSRVRYRRRLGLLAALHDARRISERETQERLTAATAFLLPTRSRRFRARVMERIRSAAIGHEPGEPGRQLEQQRDQRALREPQQQHARQHEQQQRLPSCPQLRPAVPEGAAKSPRGLNRPPSCSAGEIPAHEPTVGAPGAGSPAEAVSKAPGAPISARPLPPSTRPVPPAPERFPHAPRS